MAGTATATAGSNTATATSAIPAAAATLQAVWDVSSDGSKNTFVDANDDEILTFIDSWTPARLGAKLLGWYDAKNSGSLTVDGGNNVSNWADLSGNSNDFVQGTGSKQPLWDGTDKITFDGVGEIMSSAGLLAAASSDVAGEIYMVVSVNSASDNQLGGLFFADAGSGNYFGGYVRQDTTAGVDGVDVAIDDVFSHSTEIPTIANTIYIVTVSSDGTDIYSEYNGGNGATTAAPSKAWVADSVGTLDTCDIGALNHSSIFYQPCSYKTILYCNEQLSALERNDLFHYINQRFSVY